MSLCFVVMHFGMKLYAIRPLVPRCSISVVFISIAARVLTCFNGITILSSIDFPKTTSSNSEFKCQDL